jgi:glycogen debranching enzyme
VTGATGPEAVPEAVPAGGAAIAFGGEPAAVAGATVTLVEGSTFCLSDESGDLDAAAGHGLFFRDTRILSSWRLRVDGQRPRLISVGAPDPYRAVFVARLPTPDAATHVLVERRRYVGDGMREDIRLRNLSPQPRQVTLALEVAADFADLFAVKEDRVPAPAAEIAPIAHGPALTLGARRRGAPGRGVRVVLPGAAARGSGLELRIRLGARADWRGTVLVHPIVDDQEVTSRFPVGRPVEESQPALRMRAWRSAGPTARTADPGLGRTLRRSQDDLGLLRIFDSEHPGAAAVAAGAPWFMALFGRDSLLTSYLALPLEPGLAVGTLRMLAHRQGRAVDRWTEEEPGRILHETRVGLDFPLSHGGGSVYYGTADATPLFVHLLGELHRWGSAPAEVDALLPHADRALEWILRYGDRDGDGFVEYQRTTEHGLRNQGWKDSHDGVNFADGQLAEPPIALCEVQAYTYAAFRARAQIARRAGDADTAQHWTARAATLRRDFNDRFWLPDRGWFAVGLDRDKRPIDALTSNIGHCLWTGLIDEDKAAAVADHLLSPEMFTGWGVRTLATSMGAYNPMSYHNGSVWPHDNAIVAAGLMRYGFVGPAQRIATGMLDAAAAFGGRLPELFCGFDRGDYDAPLPYPTSCSPQAWASAAPIQLVRTLLRLEPAVPQGRMHFAPVWPARYGPLLVDGLKLAGGKVRLQVGAEASDLSGLPAGIELRAAPAPVR